MKHLGLDEGGMARREAQKLRAESDPAGAVLPEVQIPEAHGGQHGVLGTEARGDEGRLMTLLLGL